jgi:5-(carboxyamino)imidazole ribonucleotide mutase
MSVGVVMGSDSDWPVMKAAAEALEEFGVPYEADVVSAHRMPHDMIETPLPVIGVPVPLKYLDGMDSLLSIVQMPAGVPVAAVAVGNARNAGLLAVRILAASDADLRDRMEEFQRDLHAQAKAKGERLRRQSAG